MSVGVGEIADLVDDQEHGGGVVAEAMAQGRGAVDRRQISQQLAGAGEQGRGGPAGPPGGRCCGRWWTGRCRTKQRHTTGYQDNQGKIFYPFHPKFGETVEITGRNQHCGDEFLIIRQPDGTLAQIPVWMMSEEAALYAIRATPRLPLVRLRMLRTEIDLLLNSLSADFGFDGGLS